MESTVKHCTKSEIGDIRVALSRASELSTKLFGDLCAIMNALDGSGNGDSIEYRYASFVYNGLGLALDEMHKAEFILEGLYSRRPHNATLVVDDDGFVKEITVGGSRR